MPYLCSRKVKTMQRYCKTIRKQIAKIRHFREISQKNERKIAHFLICKNMSKELFSFNKGWSQVKNGDIHECRNKLMAALNIKTRAAFLNRLKGDVEPKVSEVKAIEDVFAEFGIKDIWGAA